MPRGARDMAILSSSGCAATFSMAGRGARFSAASSARCAAASARRRVRAAAARARSPWAMIFVSFVAFSMAPAKRRLK